MSEFIDKKQFYFDLPDELIAQTPLEIRDKSRLLTINKKNGEICHENFSDILDYFKEGDCIVFNNSRVIPARLIGNIATSKIEVFLLREIEKDIWECLVKPGKKMKTSAQVVFGDGILKGEVLSIDENSGTRNIKFEYNGIFLEILEKLGEMPLPHYIKEKLQDKERYQTVYSKIDGSSAAPTAGLHFTKEIIENAKKKGIFIAYVTLHVGLGTFRPVKTENIYEHKMHKEYFILDEENAEIINNAKKNAGKIIAVGTTANRVLETLSQHDGKIIASNGDTDIFITPGYKFKIVDCLITNFHLPESTLIMLVSAFCSREKILEAYQIAIMEKYRFFSFGDSMLIGEF